PSLRLSSLHDALPIYIAPSTGYETLVYDCMIGDAILFNRADGVEAGWAVVQPILDLWRDDKTVPLEIYPAGSAGPEAADNLLWRDRKSTRLNSSHQII